MTMTIIRTTIPSKIASIVHPANTVLPVHFFVTNARLDKKHLKMPPPTKPLVCCAAVGGTKQEQVKPTVRIAAVAPINRTTERRSVFPAMQVCINPTLVNRCVLIVPKDITKNRLDHKIVHRV
tara:strand:+ start:574 stop:942 length:369 start_codon:yes stop_codon:yes gene_type:complete